QPLVNIQSVPATVETVSIQSNGQPQLLNVQSVPRAVETVSVQQPVQTVNVLPNGEPLANIQSLPQTLSLQSNSLQQLVNVQPVPQTVETLNVQQPLQTLNLQAGGQPVVQTLSSTVIAQPPPLPLPVPVQTNVNIVPQPSLSVKEVQVESVAVSSPSSVVERIAQGFAPNPLVAGGEEVSELSLVPVSEQVVVSPSSSFFTVIKPEPVNVPQVYYNPLTVVPSSSRVVSRIF
ncbi:integrator complex subunit 6 homolog, partial [Apis dorsata]|uniref:integrator complex subunit 6 homolog n=1 Tax=Apis dorsata TaxID=7462 RepID=UPI001293F394